MVNVRSRILFTAFALALPLLFGVGEAEAKACPKDVAEAKTPRKRVVSWTDALYKSIVNSSERTDQTVKEVMCTGRKTE